LRPESVENLGAVVVKAVIERTGLDPALIEDVVFAHSDTDGETPYMGR